MDAEKSLQRQVHFAPDVSSIVSHSLDTSDTKCVQVDFFFDCLENRMDTSVHLRSELQTCLEGLKVKSNAILCLKEAQAKCLPLTVKDRRLWSVTRQLIAEKKPTDSCNIDSNTQLYESLIFM